MWSCPFVILLFALAASSLVTSGIVASLVRVVYSGDDLTLAKRGMLLFTAHINLPALDVWALALLFGLARLSFPSVAGARSVPLTRPAFAFDGLASSALALFGLWLLKLENSISNCIDSFLVIDLIVRHHARDVGSDVLDKGKPFQQWNVVEQLLIFLAVVPVGDGHPVLRLKHVRDGAVVKNDQILERSAHSRHVLHEDAVRERAVLSKEELSAVLLRVKSLHQWPCVLGERCCEHDELIEERHALQEPVGTRPYHHVHLTLVTLYLHLQN